MQKTSSPELLSLSVSLSLFYLIINQYASISKASSTSKWEYSSSLVRLNSTLSTQSKVTAPPMVYIAGEEMTHYTMNLIIDQWVKPYFDTTKWEYFDLSCNSRDDTDDKVLHDAVEAGKKIGAIFKEPTITPNAEQVCLN